MLLIVIKASATPSFALSADIMIDRHAIAADKNYPHVTIIAIVRTQHHQLPRQIGREGMKRRK